jgi:hypothetical protein
VQGAERSVRPKVHFWPKAAGVGLLQVAMDAGKLCPGVGRVLIGHMRARHEEKRAAAGSAQPNRLRLMLMMKPAGTPMNAPTRP